MTVNVQELYQQTVLPLPEPARLELLALIANDLTRLRPINGASAQRGSKLSELFGAASLGHATGLDNEQIDADLARAYADTNEGEAIYDERFSIEHAIRFSQQELGLVSGQFNRVAAEGREQTWVELVATVYWRRCAGS